MGQRRKKSPQPVDRPGPDRPIGRAEAAAEILETARALRQRAESSEFGLIAYLLDMVVIEARDTVRGSRAERAEK
jgi:hypothetical protein